MEASLEPRHLYAAAKHSRKSSPGLDAWTHEEIKTLPLAAWHHFLKVCAVDPLSLLSSISSVFKRVPISKKDSGGNEACDVRPIDIFSVLLRVYSTATVGILKNWSWNVLHPGQYASRKGVLEACAILAWVTETSFLGIRECWCLSVDFTKMFNMLSADVAVRVGTYMGLPESFVPWLLLPIANATGVWRLPFNAAPWPFCSTRGLPQGMAVSVLLEELEVSPLLWRVGRGVPGVTVVAYVDDLNLLAPTRSDLIRVTELLHEFKDDFSLSLSVAKTRVWASHSTRAHDLQRDTGFQATNVLDALGGQWQVSRGPQPTHDREVRRLDQCIMRLQRAKALPLPIPRLAQVISVGCLSLLDYLNLPDVKPYESQDYCQRSLWG